MNVASSPAPSPARPLGATDVVLVTGATGFTGRHLVRKLCASGAEVRAFARHGSSREGLESLPIEWFVGELTDPALIERATRGITHCFHVAAAFREAKATSTVYTDVHVVSTQRLAHAIVRQTADGHAFERFVHVSTAGVHGHVTEPPADESYRFAPGDEYQDTKAEGERWLAAFAAENGLPATIIRPCAIYGPGDRRLLKLFKLATLPVLPLPGLGAKGLYHLIHVEDLTDFMQVAATHPAAAGETYIVGAPRATSIRGIVRTAADELGTSPRIVPIPATPLLLAGDLCEALYRPFGAEPPIYRRRVAFFTKDRSFDTGKLMRDTGFACAYDNERGIRELARWYADEGWLRA